MRFLLPVILTTAVVALVWESLPPARSGSSLHPLQLVLYSLIVIAAAVGLALHARAEVRARQLWRGDKLMEELDPPQGRGARVRVAGKLVADESYDPIARLWTCTTWGSHHEEQDMAPRLRLTNAAGDVVVDTQFAYLRPQRKSFQPQGQLTIAAPGAVLAVSGWVDDLPSHDTAQKQLRLCGRADSPLLIEILEDVYHHPETLQLEHRHDGANDHRHFVPQEHWAELANGQQLRLLHVTSSSWLNAIAVWLSVVVAAGSVLGLCVINRQFRHVEWVAMGWMALAMSASYAYASLAFPRMSQAASRDIDALLSGYHAAPAGQGQHASLGDEVACVVGTVKRDDQGAEVVAECVRQLCGWSGYERQRNVSSFVVISDDGEYLVDARFLRLRPKAGATACVRQGDKVVVTGVMRRRAGHLSAASTDGGAGGGGAGAQLETIGGSEQHPVQLRSA